MFALSFCLKHINVYEVLFKLCRILHIYYCSVLVNKMNEIATEYKVV